MSTMRFFILVASALLLLQTSFLKGDQCCLASPNYTPNRVYIGPEWYHVRRTREGGSHQTGHLFGGRIGYEYLKRYNFYWAAQGSYAKGNLRGHSGGGNSLKCHDHEYDLEARIGYTFQRKHGYQFGITPFVGLGYFEEENQFLHNHPFKVRFENSFKYASFGFLSQATFCNCVTVGLNFIGGYMIKSKSKIKEKLDDLNVSFAMHMEHKFQYALELPISMRFCQAICQSPQVFEVRLVPFYRFRHYGGRFSFPFDFLDTRFHIVGAQFLVSYCF